MREVFRRMLFSKYRVDGRDDENYITEDSEYEAEDAVKLLNSKIIYEVLANKKEAIKYLIGQKLIKTENIEKFNAVLSATNAASGQLEDLMALDEYLTANKDIEFFLTKFIERQTSLKRKEDEAQRKERDRLKKFKATEA